MGARSARGARRRWFVLALPVALAWMLVPAGPAAAQTSLQVEAGIDDYVSLGEPIPLRIRVETDRLLDGEVVVTARFSQNDVVTRVPVELAGGAARELVVVVPSTTWEVPDINVALERGGDEVAESRVRLSLDDQFEFVALTPGLADAVGVLPDLQELVFGSRRARFAELTGAQLDAGIDAVDLLDTVATTEADLGELSREQRQVLYHWVATGGTLLIDQPAEPPIAHLPDGWQPGGLGHARAGAGQVRLSEGQAVDGAWDQVLYPTPAALDPNMGRLAWVGNDMGVFPGADVTSIVALDAGFRIPEVSRYLLVIGGYVLLVGPITYLVLRRLDRRAAAWLVIPAFAAVFTFGIAVFGEDLRSRNANAHATLYEVTPEGTRASTKAMVSSRSGGASTVAAPEGWMGEVNAGQPFPFDIRPQGLDGDELEVVDAADRTEVALGLEPGEFQMVALGGPVEGDEPMVVVTASANADDVVTGTVTNNTAARLEEVALFVEDRAENIGTIGPGETVSYEVDAATRQYDPTAAGRAWPEFRDPWGGGGLDIEFDEWGNPVGLDGLFDDTVYNPQLWWDAVASDPWNLAPFGQVTVAAWSSDLPSPLEQDGNPIETGRSLILARAPVEPGSVLTDTATLRHVLGEDTMHRDRAVFRLTLPTAVDGRTVDADRLVLEVPEAIREAEVLIPGRWEPLVVGLERQQILLGGDAVHDGAVYVRINPARYLRAAHPRSDDDRELLLWELDEGEEFTGDTLDDMKDLRQFFEENEPQPIDDFLSGDDPAEPIAAPAPLPPPTTSVP